MTVENRTSALANAQLAADDDIDLSNILGTLWRGKLWIALAGFLTLVVGRGMLLRWPCLYTPPAPRLCWRRANKT